MAKKNENYDCDIIAYKIDEKQQLIYSNTRVCALELGLNDSVIYTRLNSNSFKPYKGYLFKRLNDPREWVVDESKVMDPNSKRRVLDKVKAFNIVTGRTHVFDTIKICSEELNIPYATIYKQLSTGEQLPMYNHLFKWNSDDTEWRKFTVEEILHYNKDVRARSRFVESIDAVVRESFDYNPETGVVWWKHVWRNCGGARVGDILNTKDDRGYLQVHIANKFLYVHQIIWFLHYGYWAKLIDHKDQVKHHNWISNLRDITKTENNQNVANRRGYYKTPAGKFICRIRANNITYNLGTVSDEKTAKRIVHEARLKHQSGYLGKSETHT